MKFKLKAWHVYLLAIPITGLIAGVVSNNGGLAGEVTAITMISGGMALFVHYMVKDLDTWQLVIFDIGAVILVSFIWYWALGGGSAYYTFAIEITLAFIIPATYLNIKQLFKKKSKPYEPTLDKEKNLEDEP